MRRREARLKAEIARLVQLGIRQARDIGSLKSCSSS